MSTTRRSLVIVGLIACLVSLVFRGLELRDEERKAARQREMDIRAKAWAEGSSDTIELLKAAGMLKVKGEEERQGK